MPTMPSPKQLVDILAIAAHPDDIELCCAGTLLRHQALGCTIGLCDMTQGELGTRGSAELRLQEAERARQIFDTPYRINLGLRDGFFESTEADIMAVIRVIRAWRPSIVLANAPRDRHPDHGRAGHLIKRACFLAGLRKIETVDDDGIPQMAHRPDAVYHFIQDIYLAPDLVVDITDYFDVKMDTIRAYGSQFYDPQSDEPETPIAVENFLETIKGRAQAMGRHIGVPLGEGFIVTRPAGVHDLRQLI